MCLVARGTPNRRDSSHTRWRAESGQVGETVREGEYAQSQRTERRNGGMVASAPGFPGPHVEESGCQPRFLRDLNVGRSEAI